MTQAHDLGPTDAALSGKEASKARTRARLIEVARPLFEASGFEGVSNREIAKAAGFTTGALFASFTGKADLYRAAMGHAPIKAADCHALHHTLLRALELAERVAGDTAHPDALTLLSELRAFAPVEQADGGGVNTSE